MKKKNWSENIWENKQKIVKKIVLICNKKLLIRYAIKLIK